MVASLPIVADSLTLYLSEIRKFKLLGEEEERNYAIRFFEEKDLEAAQTLITSNLRYVVKVAFEYRHCGLNALIYRITSCQPGVWPRSVQPKRRESCFMGCVKPGRLC